MEHSRKKPSILNMVPPNRPEGRRPRSKKESVRPFVAEDADSGSNTMPLEVNPPPDVVTSMEIAETDANPSIKWEGKVEEEVEKQEGNHREKEQEAEEEEDEEEKEEDEQQEEEKIEDEDEAEDEHSKDAEKEEDTPEQVEHTKSIG